MRVEEHIPTLWLVIPCYNEEAVLPLTAPLFGGKLSALVESGTVSAESRVCFVDDGSADETWRIISELAEHDPCYVGIRLSRNRGHQNALLAGLMEARAHCDVTISLDCDGQDDIDAVDDMLAAYAQGSEVVYGVRSSRASDSFFKRHSAQGFYRLMDKMGVETVFNHADYRLLSARVLDHLADFGEVNLFLRGMVPLVGFSHDEVYYERAERAGGHSHYPLHKMLGLALNGITSLSVKPIRVVSALGLVFSLLGLVGVVWALVSVISGSAIAGWASTICIVSLIGGVQLLSLGVIGEYIGKIYLEVKRRPRYIISARTWE